ncbi:MAG: ABC transporter permease [Planctomycetota bacterium]|jgi:peptide/nickel transport system permease protein|nr:ABC transporter permease [Planctomycetota bacterium]
MRAYLIKRLLWMIPTLFCISVASYGMMRLAPGDPVKASFLAGDSGGEGGAGVRKPGESAAAREFRRRFYLDQPWYIGYWRWLAGDPARNRGGAIRGDFGDSVVISLGAPVWQVIAEKLPATIKLNLWSFAVIYLVSISFGVYSAVFRGSLADRLLSAAFFVMYSLPAFWIGILLIILVSKYLPWWPISGLSQAPGPDETYWSALGRSALHYVLPVACLSYGGFASLSRFTRAAVLESIRQDYVRVARAKGLSEWAVIFRHVFRNSLIPLITLAAGLLPGLLGGSMIIEYLFNIPGMGTLMLQALSSRDYPVLMTEMGLGAFLVLAGMLISDLLYAAADPRITFD